jgi:hypothetical protein
MLLALEPWQEQKGVVIYQELEEVLEVIFLMSG